MSDDKPLRFAVSYVIDEPLQQQEGSSSKEVDEMMEKSNKRGGQRRVLQVKRPLTDVNLPNVWGLPAGYCPNPPPSSGRTNPSDSEWLAALILSGHQKLGVALDESTARSVSFGQQVRDEYVLVMKQFSVAVAVGGGSPSVPQRVDGVTQYVEMRYAEVSGLQDAAAKGSLCSQLCLMNAF